MLHSRSCFAPGVQVDQDDAKREAELGLLMLGDNEEVNDVFRKMVPVFLFAWYSELFGSLLTRAKTGRARGAARLRHEGSHAQTWARARQERQAALRCGGTGRRLQSGSIRYPLRFHLYVERFRHRPNASQVRPLFETATSNSNLLFLHPGPCYPDSEPSPFAGIVKRKRRRSF